MAFNISSILTEMVSKDKDHRYMALSDLYNELEKDTFKIDASSEQKLVTNLLTLLEDISNNVQELAVKCLGPLVGCGFVKESQIQQVVETLSSHITNEKSEELRDISCIGLKTVITQVPTESESASIISRGLISKLISGISDCEIPEVKMYSLEVLNELLRKWGEQLADHHEKIQGAVLTQLTNSRAATRKRAINCIKSFAVSVPDKLFAQMMSHILGEIEATKKVDFIRSLIQAIGAISQSAGYRLGKYLDQIIPVIIANISKDEEDDELREICFQGFEFLILRCPKESSTYLNQILDLSLKLIKYDPNYDVDDEEEYSDMEEDEDEEEEDYSDDGDYSDDDDMSWKVRRSATKCLGSIIQVYPNLLNELYDKVAPVLVQRFKEREENVKLEVFSTFVQLVKQTGLAQKKMISDEMSSPGDHLRNLMSKIVPVASKQLKEKSVKTRIGCFGVLKEIVGVLENVFDDHMSALEPGISLSIGEKNTNSNLKIEALVFFKLTLGAHRSQVFYPTISSFVPNLLKCIGDSYYRISAEALQASTLLVSIMRPEAGESEFDYKPFVKDFFNATFEQLKANEIDQEVKESAITCMSRIIANLGDSGEINLEGALKLILDRLKNEITRITAVKGLSLISVSPLKIDISSILGDSLKELATFLRKANRSLKQASLTCLTDVVANYGSAKSAQSLFGGVIDEIVPSINESDLHVSHLSLTLVVTILQSHTKSAAVVADKILPQTLELVKSSLLQGLALDSTLALFGQLVKSSKESKTLAFENLLDLLTGLAKQPLSKQALSSVAQCVAALCKKGKSAQREATVTKFVKSLGGKDEGAKILALLCLGEIGRKMDLSTNNSIKKSVTSCMEASSEEVKVAASFALGNITIGNMETFLPFVLEEVRQKPKNQYLLLHSLREIIVRQSGRKSAVKNLLKYSETIIELLYQHTHSEEEGTRNVVAECLGKLALLKPELVIPSFLEKIKDDSPNTRSTVITGLKFAIVEKVSNVDKAILPHVPTFFSLLTDKDLNVRRSALLTLNYCAHNKPGLIRDALVDFLPILYGESKVKPELIREVDLGPFKHKVDDGLEIRKAAYECMYTLLETCPEQLDILVFEQNLVDGLKDHYDIKMLCHLMLIRLAVVTNVGLIEGLADLVEPLRTTVTTKVKDGAVKQEMERNDELIRGALRGIYALSKIPNLDSSVKFEEFLKSVKVGELGKKFSAIVSEVEGESGDVDAMQTD